MIIILLAILIITVAYQMTIRCPSCGSKLNFSHHGFSDKYAHCPKGDYCSYGCSEGGISRRNRKEQV